MGYPSAPGDEINQLFTILKKFGLRLSELERPSGSQTANALQQLRDLVNGLLTQVNGIFSGYVSAGTSISAGTTITAGGIITGDAGLWSTSVYNDVLTTSYHATWSRSDGKLGYVPSSRRFKRDIAAAKLGDTRAIIRVVRVVTFRYIGAVAVLGAEATVEWGVIAEEIHDLGLYWLVDYDPDGLPFGVKYERFVLLLLLGAQDQQGQIDDQQQQITDLTKRLVAAGI